jgi:TP901 family phage tail tape measure protein
MADEVISTKIVADADFSSLIADVHKVTASLSKLQENLANSNKMLANNVAVINRNFSDTLRSTSQFSSHFVSLTSDVEKFGKNLDSGRLKLRDYFSTYQGHIKTSGGLIRELARQQVAMQNAILQPLGRNAQGLMQFNVHVPRGLDAIKNKTSLARQELAIMNKVIQDGAVQLINWGKNTQWAGRQLTVGLTLPITAFGKAAADAFKVADQELTRLTKVYGDVAGTSAQELGKVRAEVVATAKELSAAYGTSFSETISLAADIAATGKQGQELLDSVKETSRLAVLGEVDRQEAMKATLAIQSAFKSNTEELTNSINFLNAVENQTSTTLNDLVEAIPKAGPVIKGLGGSVQDLALYLTAMREGGISASEGANALKSALASLINPTDKAVEKFKTMGIDLLGIVNQNAGNVTGTLLALQAALDNLNPLQKQQAIEQLFGKFQFSRLNALFENLGRQGSQTLQVLDLMKASTTDLASVAGRELTAVTESASGKYRRALESLKADLAGVGEQFLTIGTKIINIVDKALDFFNGLPKPVKTAITFLGALTAMAGPLIMLTGLLANFFGYILKGVMHMKAFFRGGEGWKYLTPEMIAAEKAGKMLEQTFYSDAKAASILQLALKNLIDEFSILEAKAKSGSISVNPAVSTMAGSVIMGAGGRVVNPQHPLVGPMGTRASTHMVPRASMTEEQRMSQTIFGLVPGSVPVNRKIGDAPQIYMNDPLPSVPGLTTVGGVSTGVVSGEAARWHAMMGTLAMQSKAEIEALKKQIATTGVVSKDFMNQFDDVLPIVSGITDNAAKQSALIVAELRAGKLTVEQARAQIIALNLEVERMITSAVGTQAAAMGRTLNPTVVPTLNQPVVDATGKSNMRELFKKSKTRDLIDKVARSLGVRTSGAGYNIETTRPRKMNTGGYVYGMNDGSIVPGPNVNADVVPAMLTPGEFVVNREATARNLPLLMAINGGAGDGGPKFATGGIQPELGQNLYGQILDIESRYQSSAEALKTPDAMGRTGWDREFRFRYIMNNASAILGLGIPGLSVDEAIRMATEDSDEVLRKSFQQNLNFGKGDINRKTFKTEAERVAKNRHKKIKTKYGRSLIGKSSAQALSATNASIKSTQLLQGLAAMDPEAASHVYSKLFPQGINPADLRARNLFESEHISPRATFGYSAAGNYLQAIGGESYLNRSHNTLSARGLMINAVPSSSRQAASIIAQQQRNRAGVPLARARAGGSRSGFAPFMRNFMMGTYRRPSLSFVGGMNDGGMVPGYNNGGIVYANKGRFIQGFRQGATPRKQGEFDPSGGMMASMAGFGVMAGGQALSGSNPMLGQSMQIAGMIMQFYPLLGMLGRAVKGFTTLGSAAVKFGSIAGRTFLMVKNAIAVLTGPIGWITAGLTAIVGLALKIRKDAAEKEANESAMFGLSEKGAKELGIVYTNLGDKIKAVREEQKLMADKARAQFESYTSAGITGISLTIKELKELKERVKTDMPEMLKTLNSIDSSQLTQWASNVKAQMVSAGKSVQEANNLIYALIESSNKAGMGVAALTDKAFNAIQDKGSAAAFVVKTLAENFDKVNSIDSDAFASNVDTAVTSMDNAVQALIGTKNAQGDILDEAEALLSIYGEMENSNTKNKVLSEDVLKTLQKERPELAAILNKGDTIGSMYAKWRLLLSGVALDLKSLTAEQAEMIAVFQAGLDAAAQTALVVGNNLSGVPNVATTLKKVNDAQLAASKKATAAANGELGANKELIKKYQEQIKLIRERANEKKKALQDTLDAENTELELQKLQLDYQAALARGDKDAAMQAQLSIRQLTKQFEVKKAMDRIDDNAAKEEAKVQSLIDKENAKNDTAGKTGQNNQNLANNLAASAAAITGFANRFTTIAGNKAQADMLDPKSDAYKKAQEAIKIDFSNFMVDLLKSANSDKYVAEAFSNLITKDPKTGKYVEAQSKTYTFPKRGKVTMGGAFDQLGNLSESMVSFSKELMGKNGISLSEIDETLKKGFKLATPKNATLKLDSEKAVESVLGISDPKNSYTPFIQVNGKPTEELRAEVLRTIVEKKKLKKGDIIDGPYGIKYIVTTGEDAIFSPAAAERQRAKGGPVMGSQSYLVGERGPELFVPAMSGSIVPNHLLGPSYNIPSNTISGIGGAANNSYNNNVYNIDIALNGTNVTVDDVMNRFKSELALVNAKQGRIRTVGGTY